MLSKITKFTKICAKKNKITWLFFFVILQQIVKDSQLFLYYVTILYQLDIKVYKSAQGIFHHVSRADRIFYALAIRLIFYKQQ